MRLLQVDENGEFSLTGDLINNIPPYAILSHTWGEDHEEVNFIDLTRGPRVTKAGYKKLRFCAGQAARDGLQHFWVDTCCINKENNTELSEAITSMYRWYSKAAKCYVYLSDVSLPGANQASPSLQLWESAFCNSRWFTRGWTLQELLAPTSVEFFCSKGTRLGDKGSLEQQIHKITKIPVQALQGAPLSTFSIDERMSWTKMRQTKRGEDKAYSLLGLFDISMPLIYGEGEEKAFHRLQKEIRGDNPLDHLPYAAEAPFNSFSRQHDPTCFNDTRIELLNEVYTWADGQDKRCIFWLNGLAGTGKSTIARTVARRYYEQQRLAASFFFSKGGGEVGHAGLFVTSIAVQLAQNVPASRQHIHDAITERRDIANQSLQDQWHHLVLCPLSKLREPSSHTLVIDALDECDDHNVIRLIVQLLAKARSLETVRLRVFLTSRPDVPIRHGFDRLPDAERQDFVLHDISPSIVDHDIKIFLEHELGLIGHEDGQDMGWPGVEAIKTLVRSASGLFIWAATACRFIREGLFAEERLRMLVEGSDFDGTATPEEHLSQIYITVLQATTRGSYTAGEVQKHHTIMRQILGSIVTLLSPLSICSLSNLLLLPKQRSDRMLKDLHAIINIPKDQSRPLRLHHPSFRDFLLNKDRCGDANFWVDEKQAHYMLADNCIQLMTSALKQDICGFDSPSIPVEDVQRDRVEKSLSPEVQYACLYYIEHLTKSGAQLHDNNHLHVFLQEHFLHWLEALGWIGRVSEGVHAISSLESFAIANDCPNLFTFIHDMKRFALYGRALIEKAPLQVYCSILAFAPSNSTIRQQYSEALPRWIKVLPKVESEWGPLLQTLEGHSSLVNAVTFSPNGQLLVSASSDGEVKLWEPGSGALLQTLKGHSSSVNTVTFSLNGQLLASASYDGEIKLWETGSGALLQTFKGYSSRANAMTFSSDGKLLASASDGETVKLWEAKSEALLQTFEGHSSRVNAVTFSLNGQLLASASSDRTVRLWETRSRALLQTFEGHLSRVSAVAFSPNSQLLASVSDGGEVKLWETRSGALLQTFEGHSSWVNAVTFSPNGQLLASASDDETVKLWEAGSGALLQTLEGHSSSVNAVTFSPNSQLLVSSSHDRSVKLWEPRSGSLLQARERHSSRVNIVTFSPNGQLLASASHDRAVKLWEPGSGALLQVLEGHSSRVISVAFSPNGRLLASASYDGDVKLWDAKSGALLQTLEGHSSWVNTVTFSPNGQLLASASDDRTVRLWGTISGALLQTFEGHSFSVNIVTFSPNGQLLASASNDRTVKLWDTESGALLQTLKGHSPWANAMTFSPDGQLLVSTSASDGETIKLWEAKSGALLQTFGGHSSRVNAVAFSPNGQLLASASNDETVKLWEAGSGVLLQTHHVGVSVLTIAFSKDGASLQTDRGSWPISFSSSSSPAVPQPQLPPSIFVNREWICHNTKPILWLPPGYRPTTCAVHGCVVGLVYQSGRVSIIEFAF